MKVEIPNKQFCIYPGVSQYTGRHWLKYAMKLAFNADYTHAWIAFRLYGQLAVVYHSTGFGVHVKNWQGFQSERVVKGMWEVQLEEDTFHSFIAEAFTETGKRYSNKQLFGIAVAKVLGLNELPFGANRDDEHVCSETAGRMLLKYTDLEWGEKNPDLYTPKDFWDTCSLLQISDEAKRLV